MVANLASGISDTNTLNLPFPTPLNARRLTILLFVFAITVGVLTSASQEVSPEFLLSLSWRLIGPFRGGRSVAVSGIPGDSKTFYFGAAGGGVWKTTHAGTLWAPIFDNESVASVGAIQVAPSDPKVIYVGTGESDIRSDLGSGDGVYKSTDAGKTWRNLGLKDSRQISRIIVDPRNPDVVYIGVFGHAYASNPERGVYKSTDGGATWQHSLDKGPEIGVSDLAIADDKPETLIAGMWNARRPPWSTYGPLEYPGSGIFRSLDAGATWQQLSGHGLPYGDWGRVGVAISRDGRRVYALIDAKPAGLYCSNDGGDNWDLANGDPRLTNRSWYFNSLTVDPNDSDVVYIPNIALYRSVDGGKTISIVRGAPGGDDYHQLWVDPKDSSRLLLASDQGTSISLDRGNTWTSWYNQPTGQFYHLITDHQFPYLVYGAQQDSGSAAVPSRTDHLQITPRDWFTTSASEGGYFAPDPKDPNILYATDAYGAVERFDRRTSLSQNIAPWPVIALASNPSSVPWAFVAGSSIALRKYRAPWTPMLIFSPVDKTTLYLGTQYVMTTIDGGLHWNRISPDLTGAGKSQQVDAAPLSSVNARENGYGVVSSIAPSPLDRNVVWAGSDTGLIHMTRDGGKSWKDVTPRGLANWSKVSLIEASHFSAGRAYVAIDRHAIDDYRPYIFRTLDFGRTWQEIDHGIASSSFVRAVREDARNSRLLFAGTELGVSVSFDEGDNWQRLQLNLPTTSVRDLQVHGDDLVIATHGRGLWILDDIEPLRQIRADTRCPDACFFRPVPAFRVDNNAFHGTPLPPEEPTAKNPPDGAILDYFLPRPAEKVTLRIFDKSQQIIRSFSSSDDEAKRHLPSAVAERWFPEPQHLSCARGMHRFVWDLRWRSSGQTAADDDSNEVLVPPGPRVPPGAYEIELMVDGRKFTQQLRVRMDPRVSADASVLNEHFTFGKRIYEEAFKSGRAMGEIEAVQRKLADLGRDQFAKDPALLMQVEDLQRKMREILKGGASKASNIAGLLSANYGLDAAFNAVGESVRAVPAQVLSLYQESRLEAERQISTWEITKNTELSALNENLRRLGMAPIQINQNRSRD